MTLSIPYVITISDGVSIRTIHPPALGEHRAVLEAALTAVIKAGNSSIKSATVSHPYTPHGAASGVSLANEQKGVPPRHALLSPPDSASANTSPRHIETAPHVTKVHGGPAAPEMMTQGELARVQGFTGDACTVCQGFSMRRNGTCLLCVDCGATTGCS